MCGTCMEDFSAMKRHWYSIDIQYVKNNKILFTKNTTVGVVFQSDIMKHRSIRKSVGGFIRQSENAKPILCNGNLNIDVRAYLGHFKHNSEPNFRQLLAYIVGDWITNFFIVHLKSI
jgi:hypothetical protein